MMVASIFTLRSPPADTQYVARYLPSWRWFVRGLVSPGSERQPAACFEASYFARSARRVACSAESSWRGDVLTLNPGVKKACWISAGTTTACVPAGQVHGVRDLNSNPAALCSL